MYIILFKNDVAMSKVQRKKIETLSITPYDKCIEVTKEEFNKIKLPARLVNGEWVKTDDAPQIDYPPAPEREPTEAEQLRADIDYIAVMTGIEL